MTSKDLIALMECGRKYRLQALSLKGQDEKNLCFYRALGMLAEGVAKGNERQKLSLELADYLKEAYKEEWFYLDWQKEKAVRKDSRYLARFLESYPVGQKQKAVAGFPVSVAASLVCNEVAVETISGKADLLLQDEDGMLTGVILCRQFIKPYSYYARKEDHQVMNSVELLVLMEGLMQKFPGRKVRVQMIRMVAPEDALSNEVPFEQKRGKNIIEFTSEDFYAVYPGGVLPHLQEVVKKAELADCEECLYHEMCHRANIMHHKKTDNRPMAGKKLHLSEVQQEAASFGTGPLCDCAAPGSGKTAVLVERVKHLIEAGVAPQKILAITFTRKAVQEMTERIAMENGPVICTMHALAFRILTEQEYLIGTVRLASVVDCKYLLLKILNHAPLIAGVSYDGLTARRGLIDSLLKDFAFLNAHGKEEFARAFPKKDTEGILAVKQMYDEIFREMGYLTYDEQITMATDLLKRYPGVLDAVRDMFDYIMVDEVQDLDEAQTEFVKLLVRPPQNNLMIFGDADQAIYGFRGGSNRFLLDFLDCYPEAGRIQLSRNYRSSKEIVALANGLISKNQMRVPLAMEAKYAMGYKPVHIPGFRMPRIAELIQEICQKGYPYQDIAIIARTNKELEEICGMLNRRAAESGIVIPFDRPKYYLRQDFVFQTLLDLLELKVKGMGQDKPLYRLLTAMGCEVDKENPKNSIYEDHLKNRVVYDFEGSEASRYYLDEKDLLMRAYARIYKALQKWQLPVKQALEDLQAELFTESVCTEEVFIKLQEIIYEKKIVSYEQLYEAMVAIKLFEDDTRVYYKKADTNRIHLLTAHDAKGKEFPVVIVWNIDEFEGGGQEEDRRTLYVAITRAKRVLFLLESYQGKSSYLRELSELITINRRERYEK